MNLAYCNAGISISETFVYDLAVMLSQKVNLTFLAGEPQTMPVPFPYENLKYIKKHNFLEQKINAILAREYRLKSNINFAERKLKGIKDYDVAYIDFGTTAIYFDKILTRKGIPYVVHFHGHDITSALNNSVYRNYIKRIYKNSFAVIAPSFHIKRLLILDGCPEEKIQMIRYGFRVKSIAPMPWSERIKSPPSIIFVGRLTHKKNPLALIRAFHIVSQVNKEVKLSMIGDGALLMECKGLIRNLHLEDKVTFYGAMDRDKIFRMLNQHWIYAQHSVTPFNGDQEGFPLSLAEAALHELPLVSTIHSGITENIIDGVTGYTVQEYNYEAMAQKMIYLIQHPEICEQMGKAGRERISKECDLEDRVEKIHKILCAAIG